MTNVHKYWDNGGYRYLAYCADGFSFRVAKLSDGSWYARPSHIQAETDLRSFGAATLKGVAAKIAASHRECK